MEPNPSLAPSSFAPAELLLVPIEAQEEQKK
jgi:hypothetical protein